MLERVSAGPPVAAPRLFVRPVKNGAHVRLRVLCQPGAADRPLVIAINGHLGQPEVCPAPGSKMMFTEVQLC